MLSHTENAKDKAENEGKDNEEPIPRVVLAHEGNTQKHKHNGLGDHSIAENDLQREYEYWFDNN